MPALQSHTARVSTMSHQDHFTGVVERAINLLREQLESAALCVAVFALWGLVAYFAVISL